MRTLHAVEASGLLATFDAAGVLGAADVHVARRLAELTGEADERVQLACALTTRALRAGSVCIELASVAQGSFDVDEDALDVSGLPWPDPEPWLAAVAASPMVTPGAEPRGARPLRLVDDRLYLERYWGHEESVRARLGELRQVPDTSDAAALEASLDRAFGPRSGEDDRQRLAARTAATHALTVIAGGPGTGKTTTVAALLQVLLEQPGEVPRIALAAPTGKAAVRLGESLRDRLPSLDPSAAEILGRLKATTLHSLLGTLPRNPTRFRHDRTNPLPYDVVVVDECSMVSLAHMDRLLEALRPGCRLVLVGDPDQLASVEAGAVLADITQARSDRTGVVELTRTWRFGSTITGLARAIRTGDADGVLDLLRSGGPAVELVAVDLADGAGEVPGLRERVVATQRRVWEAARHGRAADALAALDEHRLLCGHNTGPFGVRAWQWQVERWLAEELPGERGGDDFHVGRPLLLGTNMRDLDLWNGDTGVVVATDEGPRAAFARGTETRLFSPTQLADVATLYAMTVHKSQGSQYGHVSVVLPPVGSPLLRRELLYTAVTRAQEGVTLVATEEAVRQAVLTPARRATGLRDRL